MNISDRVEGAIIGAIFSGVVGQVPPFTALPEEIVSIPMGAIIGGVLGGRKIKRILRF